jgi:hypothetical protein
MTTEPSPPPRRGVVVPFPTAGLPRRRSPATAPSESSKPAGSPPAFNLPTVRVGITIFYPLFGMTDRQVNLAFHELLNGPDDAFHRFSEAPDRTTEHRRALAEAIEVQRQELLAALSRRYPAAARRIVAGPSKAGPRKGKKAGRAKAG